MAKAEEPPAVLAWTGEPAAGPSGVPDYDSAGSGQLAMDFEPADKSVPWRGDPEDFPPPFTPYDAKYKQSGDEIISHDPHLNEDGK
jgi:hypothetical protein